MKQFFIVDAVNFLFRAYFAIGPMTGPSGESTGALFGFIRSLMKLLTDHSPDRFVAVFDGPNNKLSRTELYKEYKSHRPSMPEDLFPQLEEAIRFCGLAGIPVLQVPGVEADDTIGSVAVWAEKLGFETVICSSDKDLCQLVNQHVFVLNPHKENLKINAAKVEELFGVRPDQMVDYLALVGDASDNIPGVSGWGAKTAAAVLQEMDSLDQILKHPERVPGDKRRQALIDEQDTALLSRELARIDRKIPIPHEDLFYHLHEPSLPELDAFYREKGFFSLARGLNTEQPAAEKKQEQVDYRLLTTSTGLAEMMGALAAASEIVIDCETTSLSSMQSRIVGIGFSLRAGEAWYLPFNGNFSRKELDHYLVPLFADRSKKWIGHNIKFDLHALCNEGYELAPPFFDTMIASYLVAPHQTQHNLDRLSLEIFHKTKIPITDLIGKGKTERSMTEVPVEQVAVYCGEDVDYTKRLQLHFGEELGRLSLESLFHEIEMPLLPVLLKMERVGMYADLHALQQLSHTLHTEIRKLEHTIYKMAGEEFNINSPKQLSDILFTKLHLKPPKKTLTGYSTAADVLETLREEAPIVDHILHYRLLEKLRSTYTEKLPDQIDPKTGRIHCTFSQSTAATGRLSCQDPNLQNIPIRSEEGRKVRAAFRPQHAGHRFLSADYSQIELRILAHLSEDPHLVQAFHDGKDIHAFTAARVFGVPLKDVTPEMRHKAKAVNFGILYGQQAYGLSQEVGMSQADAAKFIESYFAQYPKVREFLEFCKEAARKSGRAVTLTGRQRPIPDINSKNFSIRQAAERLAINTPLQGTAADLIKMAMIQIDQHLSHHPHLGVMILQIHDELLFEVPQEQVHHLTSVVKKIMEQVVLLRVPLLVDIGIGKNWEEC